MTILPFTPYEILQLIFTAILIYVTWKSYQSTKCNTCKCADCIYRTQRTKK